MAHCQYCHNKKLIQLNGKYYCEVCESYFTIKEGIQEYSYVPIEDTEEEIELCHKCKKKKGKVECRTFKEYYKKIPYCKNCKEKNFTSIKNGYFRCFILYKETRSLFGWGVILVLSMGLFSMEDFSLLTVISSYIKNILPYNVVRPYSSIIQWGSLLHASSILTHTKSILLILDSSFRFIIFLYIEYKRRRLGIIRILLLGLLYHILPWSHLLDWALFFYYFYIAMTEKTWMFNVPINRDEHFDIQKYLHMLKLDKD